MIRSTQHGTPAAWICVLIVGCTPAPPVEDPPNEITLMVFHNNSGPMCLSALAWLDAIQSEYPGLVIEEHLTTEPAGLALFMQLKTQYGQSQGVSTSFGYLPVIVLGGQAFSGFNDDIQQALTAILDAPRSPST